MKTNEMIAVMQAADEGKTIQCRSANNELEDWKDINLPLWDWVKSDYRVKPEPEYQPFTTIEEVFEAIKEHGDWLKCGNICYVKILKIHNTGIEIFDAFIPFEKLVESDYTFADGTPFGKLNAEK